MSPDRFSHCRDVVFSVNNNGLWMASEVIGLLEAKPCPSCLDFASVTGGSVHESHMFAYLFNRSAK